MKLVFWKSSPGMRIISLKSFHTLPYRVIHSLIHPPFIYSDLQVGKNPALSCHNFSVKSLLQGLKLLSPFIFNLLVQQNWRKASFYCCTQSVWIKSVMIFTVYIYITSTFTTHIYPWGGGGILLETVQLKACFSNLWHCYIPCSSSKSEANNDAE